MTDHFVDLAALGTLHQVADGGQGTVHELREYELEAGGGPLLAKLYDSEVVVSGRALAGLVAWRHKLSEAERTRLDAIAAWPLQVVGDEDRADGMIMRAAPAAFRHQVHGPKGPSEKLREAQWLFLPDRKLAARKVAAPSEAQRRGILRAVAEALALLHERGIVYGDLSARNVLYSTGAEPAVFLLDCDSVRRHGASGALEQPATPDWDDPAHTKNSTVASDLYKLGLFAVRLAAGSLSARDATAVRRLLGPAGEDMARTALGGDTSARPTAQDWVALLDTAGKTGSAGRLGTARPEYRKGWVRTGEGWARDPSVGASVPPTDGQSGEERRGWRVENGRWVRLPAEA